MAKKFQFDYQAAKDSGYSDDEIFQYASQEIPDYDFQGALQSGYSASEIFDHLNQPEKKSKTEKAVRSATQLGIGAIENVLMPYEIAAAPISSKDAQTIALRENIFDEIGQLEELKMLGVATPKDLEFLDAMKETIKNPEKLDQYVQTANIGTQGIVEGITGQDLHPEGIIEKASRWLGFLKDPRRGYQALKEISKEPNKVVSALKEAIPGTNTLRSAAVGTALQMAEENQFGPIGTLAVAVGSDILGHTPGAAINIAKEPKRAAASILNLFSRNNSNKAWTKDLIKSANEAGIQLDAGTLTDSNFIRLMQARAAQSGLVGDALDNFRKDLSSQFVNEYKKVADSISESMFENNFQAAEAVKSALKVEEQNYPIFKDYNKPSRSLQGRVSSTPVEPYEENLLNTISREEFPNNYVGGETLKTVAEDIKTPIKQQFSEEWDAFNNEVKNISSPQIRLAENLRTFVEDNRGSLLLGESTAEHRVLSAAENLLNRLRTEEGAYHDVNLFDLIKTKRTLADVADWEIGTTNFSTRYKELVREIDSAISQTLQEVNPELLERFQELNASYSMYKDIFENKNIRQLFEPKNENYNAIYSSYTNNNDKLRSLEDMFSLTERGEQVLNQVKRDYALNQISQRNFTEKDLRNLIQSVGEEFRQPLEEYYQQRSQNRQFPRAQQQESLGLQVQRPQTAARNQLQSGRISKSPTQKRKDYYKFISGKSSDQIMKQMDTIDGLKKLREVLDLTPEGKKLFKELSRFKLEEMIGKKMVGDLKDNVSLGTFSNLLKSTKNRELLKELVGPRSYGQIRKLQKLARALDNSATKFYNASKSGSTVADIGLISSGIIGLLTGNPFMFFSTLGSAQGMRIAANLLADADFLKLLEKAVVSKNEDLFLKTLEKMRPHIEKATQNAVIYQTSVQK